MNLRTVWKGMFRERKQKVEEGTARTYIAPQSQIRSLTLTGPTHWSSSSVVWANAWVNQTPLQNQRTPDVLHTLHDKNNPLLPATDIPPNNRHSFSTCPFTHPSYPVTLFSEPSFPTKPCSFNSKTRSSITNTVTFELCAFLTFLPHGLPSHPWSPAFQYCNHELRLLVVANPFTPHVFSILTQRHTLLDVSSL